MAIDYVAVISGEFAKFGNGQIDKLRAVRRQVLLGTYSADKLVNDSLSSWLAWAEVSALPWKLAYPDDDGFELTMNAGDAQATAAFPFADRGTPLVSSALQAGAAGGGGGAPIATIPAARVTTAMSGGGRILIVTVANPAPQAVPGAYTGKLSRQDDGRDVASITVTVV